jgi:hydroxyacylglutathione hydrolase
MRERLDPIFLCGGNSPIIILILIVILIAKSSKSKIRIKIKIHVVPALLITVSITVEFSSLGGILHQMQIESKELPPIGTNAFALIDTERGECVIVDAPAEAYGWATDVATACGCKIVALILTHGHWDHILDGWKFAEAGIPTYGHADDRMMFAEPSCMASYAIPGTEFKPVSIDHWIEAGRTIELLGQRMEVRHVPGHCPGNVLIYLPDEEAAFVGDALFAGSIGRYDLPGGDFSILEKSIREQIYTLPDATAVYPGHGPDTTVAAEKSGNPFVRP